MRSDHFLFDLAEKLSGPPNGGPIQKWSVGAGVAAVVAGYGVKCCMTGRATVLNLTARQFEPIRRGLWREVTGPLAITIGGLILSVALFIHFQWFWGNHEPLIPYHEIAKIVATILVAAMTLFNVYAMIAWT